MHRIIFHIDVNSAFLSWSAVKMVREGMPDIRLVPSVVSGDPSDRRSIITAVILNEARRLLAEVWDGRTPIRQVGLGVSKLTHESAIQMSLFEDPKMEYYREWDRKYDEN